MSARLAGGVGVAGAAGARLRAAADLQPRIKPIYKAARERRATSRRGCRRTCPASSSSRSSAARSRRPSGFDEATEAYYDQQIRAINAAQPVLPVQPRRRVPQQRVHDRRRAGTRSSRGGSVHARQARCVPRVLVAAVRAGPDAGARERHGPARRRPRRGGCSRCSTRPTSCPMRRTRAASSTCAARWSCANVTFSLRHRTVSRASRHGLPSCCTTSRSRDRARARRSRSCGPSGSGKSTVLNLLLRFYDPVDGEVAARRPRPARRSGATSLRRHFALVQQETFLFNDSILDNIRYGHAEATMEQVIAAAKAANAHEFITEAAQRLRHEGRRARRAPVRRAEAAHQHRPRVPRQPAASCCSTSRPAASSPIGGRHHRRSTG